MCPLGGKCLTKATVYGATVKADKSTETYTGLSEPTFKQRFTVHKGNFKHREQNGTRLSTHIWQLKDNKATYTIYWHIITKSSGFNPATGQCRLCLLETYYIMFKPEGASLNSRSEFYNTCRHKTKHLLGT